MGSAASFVDLHPSFAQSSSANAADGILQGGDILLSSGAHRAVLWSGTAASMIDITPGTALDEGMVRGMVPGQQAGWAATQFHSHHAAIWSGSAASFVDLHPVGLAGISELRATCGIAQAGYANTFQYGITAGVWYGTAQSFVPLAPFLPAGYHDSIATSVAIYDNLLYVGGYATSPATGNDEAVLWIGPVPAPGSFGVLVMGGVLAVRRRRR